MELLRYCRQKRFSVMEKASMMKSRLIAALAMSVAVLSIANGATAQTNKPRACIPDDPKKGFVIERLMRAMAHPYLSDKKIDQEVIAWHRGAWEHEPDNSFSAYEEAWRRGAEIIEVDVRIDKDGVPWMIHDDVLDRVTNVRRKFPDKATYIRDTSTAELETLLMRRRDGSLTTEHMPKLSAFLDWYYGKVLCNPADPSTNIRIPWGPVIALDIKGSKPKNPGDTSEMWDVMKATWALLGKKLDKDDNNGWRRVGLGIFFKMHLDGIPDSAEFEKTLGVTGLNSDGSKDWDKNFVFVINSENPGPSENKQYQGYKDKPYTIGFEINQNNPDSPIARAGWYEEFANFQFSPAWGPIVGGRIGRSLHQYLEMDNFPEGRATGGTCCRTNETPGFYQEGPDNTDMKGYVQQFFHISDVMTTDDPDVISDLYVSTGKMDLDVFRNLNPGSELVK